MNRVLFSSLALAVTLAVAAPVSANERKPGLELGTLEALPSAAARFKVQAWLKEVGKADPATDAKLEAVWKAEERSVVDRLADSIAFGNDEAAKLLADARSPVGPAPTKVADFFKDAKVPAFVRANFALGYARALTNRHVYDEVLETLKLFNPEQVAEPSAYLFHRAVAEHALLQKADATRSIRRLLGEAREASPERYKTVSMLMLLDMDTWKEKDLGSIARKMKVIEDRLDLARGGPRTQKLQKEVVMRLDEMIKEMENKSKPGGGKCNGGACPNGGQQPGSGSAGGDCPKSPMQDSTIANNGGPGHVDAKKQKKLAEEWGRLPPRERERALQELTRDLSPRFREAIENSFRNLAQSQTRR